MNTPKNAYPFFRNRLSHFAESHLPFLKIAYAMSFPDFSRRFFASLAEKVYTFLFAILEEFTYSPIPCCLA